jgi:beta-glucosidase
LGLKIEKSFLKENEETILKFDLKNTGNFNSDEVVQLYVSFPDSKSDRPSKALKGFKRISVDKGQKIEVSLPLKASDLTYWDIEKQAFVLEKGLIEFFIGSSSADTRLKGVFQVR